MPKRPSHVARTAVTLTALACSLLLAPTAQARPGFFESRCAVCHTDDTPSCDGCHYHRGGLQANTDLDEYFPGDPVTITLDGGAKGSGWIRAVLYDDGDAEIDRASGPTGTGDDGLGSPVAFPVDIETTAPDSEGDYVWTTTYFAGKSDGSGHIETDVSVTISVKNPVGITEATWGRLKAASRQ